MSEEKYDLIPFWVKDGKTLTRCPNRQDVDVYSNACKHCGFFSGVSKEIEIAPFFRGVKCNYNYNGFAYKKGPMEIAEEEKMNEEKQQKEKQYFSDIKIGDRVWSLLYGWGEVISEINMSMFTVNFGKGILRDFLYNGKGTDNEKQSLFWDEIQITPPPKPKRKIKKEGWMNVYRNCNIWETKEIAQLKIMGTALDTIKIEWEEYE